MVVVICTLSIKLSTRAQIFATCIENIDIGGPSMLRSAAKNFESVTVVMTLSLMILFWKK